MTEPAPTDGSATVGTVRTCCHEVLPVQLALLANINDGAATRLASPQGFTEPVLARCYRDQLPQISSATATQLPINTPSHRAELLEAAACCNTALMPGINSTGYSPAVPTAHGPAAATNEEPQHERFL